MTPVRAVREGHFANCSATGSVVGAALLSAAAVGLVVNTFADRFARWLRERGADGDGGGRPGGGGGRAGDGGADGDADAAGGDGAGAREARGADEAGGDGAGAREARGADAAGGDGAGARAAHGADAAGGDGAGAREERGADAAGRCGAGGQGGGAREALGEFVVGGDSAPGGDAPALDAAFSAVRGGAGGVGAHGGAARGADGRHVNEALGPRVPAPRLRWEQDGAVVAWPDPPALLDLTPEAAAGAVAAGAVVVGAGMADVPGALRAPTEVHVSLGDRCPVACSGCYLGASPDGADADAGALMADLDGLAAMGVFEVAVGGGEPLRHPGLEAVIERVRGHGMVANVTTSGIGLTPARAAWLAARAGQVNVSLDGLGPDYARVRGWDGAGVALRAIGLLRDAGARVGVNTVITSENIDGLPALADALAGLGVVEWHWIRFKPVGRGAQAPLGPTAAQLDGLWPLLRRLEAEHGLRVRVDCALVPLVVGGADAPELDALSRLGVTGCAGGASLLARRSDGSFAPCSYASADPSGVSAAAGPAAAWRDDPTLRAWRARAADPPEPCASCPVRSVCRGGCRVVAGAVLGDALAPDPDCPRVRAWAAARAA